MSKPFSWSYSRLSSFELCPSKYIHDQSISYDDASEEVLEGRRQHKSLENHVNHGQVLPKTLERHAGELAKLIALPGEKLVEHQLAITNELKPSSWFGRNTWSRAIIDFAIVFPSGGAGVIVDYKSGKRRLNWEQVELQAMVLMIQHPKLDTLRIGYFWTKTGKFDWKIWTREDGDEKWIDIRERVARMGLAVKAGVYPPKQNFLCRKWCANTSCKYNGI